MISPATWGRAIILYLIHNPWKTENILQQPIQDAHLAYKNIVFDSGKSTFRIFGWLCISCLDVHKTTGHFLGAVHAYEGPVPRAAKGPLTAFRG